jgi:predicted nucleic acid-binding protein
MGVSYLWDTNTVIYYLQQQFPKNAEVYVDSLALNSNPAISAITEIELLFWRSASTNDISIIESFIDDAFVFELDNPIKRLAASIRKNYSLKLGDAIIAATTLVFDLTLLTRNTADFRLKI